MIARTALGWEGKPRILRPLRLAEPMQRVVSHSLPDIPAARIR